MSTRVLQNTFKYAILLVRGEVSEWSNVPLSKSGVPQGTEGSNPSLSARLKIIQNLSTVLFCFSELVL